MATKKGSIIGALGGAAAGFIIGGPAGAAIGAATGFSGGSTIDASSNTRKETKATSEAIRGQAIKADEMAKKQARQAEQALQKISQSRVRASARRVRGGLFGDSQAQQYNVASRLGG